MLGHRGREERARFWDHCFEQEEWESHPAADQSAFPRDRDLFKITVLEQCSGLIPLVLHVDGAEFYANSEYYVWSLGSAFASGEVGVS